MALLQPRFGRALCKNTPFAHGTRVWHPLVCKITPFAHGTRVWHPFVCKITLFCTSHSGASPAAR